MVRDYSLEAETVILSSVQYFLRVARLLSQSRVGSKGELFPPKRIRETLGLQPHTKVIYKIEGGRLLVEPVPSLEEVLKEPPSVEITLKEFHLFRRELSRKAES